MSDPIQDVMTRRADFMQAMAAAVEPDMVPISAPAVADPTGVAPLPPSPPRDSDKAW